MDRFIQTFRGAVTDLIKGRCSIPVYGHLPDDVAHLPVHVVGRPTIRESRAAGVMTMTLTVTLLGRRISDEDSQAELDALGDELFSIVGGTKNIKTPTQILRCVTFNPGTVLVAGMEYPAYLADLSAEIVSC